MSGFASRPSVGPTGAPSARLRWATPILLAAALVMVLTAFGAATPPSAKALSLFSTRCDGVVLRTRPSTSSTKVATLGKAVRVVAVDRVSGGSWRTVCGSTVAKGTSWYKLTVVNYKDVKARYGVSAVYVASSLLKRLFSISYKKPLCDTSLRTSASTGATRKAIIPAGTKVTVSATVTGKSWSATCAGRSVSGTTWYQVKEVNGRSVSSQYGVATLYAAKGLFTSWSADSTTSQPTPTATPKATPTPTPKPTPTPTPKPTATPAPESTPTPTPAPTATPAPTPTPAPTTGYIEGIDVSHWQGTIDWAKVKAAGKKFAFIKASEDIDFVDDMYATNRTKAKANGILVGAYHFARPGTNTNDAINEADHFVDTAKPVSGELLPVLDLEVTGGLTDSQLAAWAKSFLDRVYARTGVKGAIYVSPSFWSSNAGNSTNLATAGYKTLWIAHWTTGSAPTVPANNWGGNGWTFWQYTSSGTVSGISGRVDLNRYRFSSFSRVLIP